MGDHQLQESLDRADFTGSGKAFWIPSINLHLLQWGPAVPSGDAAAVIYLNTAATSEDNVLYTYNAVASPTWTAADL